MIDLTPLDVRKKKGDFRRGLRGYESAVVDEFLDLVAERLEELVRENATLRERTTQLTQTVTTFRERESAMNDALVSAQQLREEFRAQASRDSDLLLREAKADAARIGADAKRQALAAAESTRRVHAQRARFLRAYRTFMERQLSDVEQEEERVRADVNEARERAPATDAPEASPEAKDPE